MRASCHAGSPMPITTTMSCRLRPCMCIWTTIPAWNCRLRGEAQAVRHFADHVIAERSVRHGELMIIPVQAGKDGSDG